MEDGIEHGMGTILFATSNLRHLVCWERGLVRAIRLHHTDMAQLVSLIALRTHIPCIGPFSIRQALFRHRCHTIHARAILNARWAGLQ
jgi:hypothetical protein